MSKLVINGHRLEVGHVAGEEVMSSNLGHHEQCYYMVVAACKALGLDYEQTSPSDIEDAIKHMKDKLNYLGDNHDRDTERTAGGCIASA